MSDEIVERVRNDGYDPTPLCVQCLEGNDELLATVHRPILGGELKGVDLPNDLRAELENAKNAGEALEALKRAAESQ